MSFAVLFAVDSFARAVVSTVVSVQAYDLLKSGQNVSLLFTASACWCRLARSPCPSPPCHGAALGLYVGRASNT